ncbi:hypothetical protein JYK14_28120 [Siccirubricoccus sp. KC 17139]|uniref:MFS transporter n=1 Tax=Siccirubricoccus soli TaxID=2899147 RepID=A0ABT1DDI7_9PROT|nr:hypothetical protein [Siccirubricoccus soli]MCO6420001.1 hypothetical protein [Siccirubricoccus soli]MCP2686136.1 hypothetical protein [Siccirubricoccus soli]
MQDTFRTVMNNAIPVAGGLSLLGAISGYAGLVLPTTACFLVAGLLLMAASTRRAA